VISTDFWVTNHFAATYLGPGAPVEDRFLGVYMSRAWMSFVATGDPNNANGERDHFIFLASHRARPLVSVVYPLAAILERRPEYGAANSGLLLGG
jgi:hypothetical protein